MLTANGGRLGMSGKALVGGVGEGQPGIKKDEADEVSMTTHSGIATSLPGREKRPHREYVRRTLYNFVERLAMVFQLLARPCLLDMRKITPRH
jgi:hypothetical protein